MSRGYTRTRVTIVYCSHNANTIFYPTRSNACRQLVARETTWPYVPSLFLSDGATFREFSSPTDGREHGISPRFSHSNPSLFGIAIRIRALFSRPKPSGIGARCGQNPTHSFARASVVLSFARHLRRFYRYIRDGFIPSLVRGRHSNEISFWPLPTMQVRTFSLDYFRKRQQQARAKLNGAIRIVRKTNFNSSWSLYCPNFFSIIPKIGWNLFFRFDL